MSANAPLPKVMHVVSLSGASLADVFDNAVPVQWRIDLLDLKGREDLIVWLDILAQDGEINTALIFGTLKALPTTLPQTIAAHWLENGVVAQLKEAA